MKRILILPGDGIGPEVTDQARRVLEWFLRKGGISAEMEVRQYGVSEYKRGGKLMPEETAAAIEAADVILFGAFGLGGADDQRVEAQYDGGLLYLRKWRQYYANLRPVYAFPSMHGVSSLKDHVVSGVDMVIVRELIGGLYFGEPRGVADLPNGEQRGFNTQVYDTHEIRRIAKVAFELARSRRGKLCSVDKANVLESSVLWRKEVQAMHDQAYPEIELSHMYVDNCAMQLVRRPGQFDVILTDNIFGDILSDCAAMVTGSLGMLPSASFGPTDASGRRQGFFEPVHGSAPDIAGQGIANPIGSILSLAMALRLSLDRPDYASMLTEAVANALSGGARTADLCEAGQASLGCQQMGDEILRQLELLS